MNNPPNQPIPGSALQNFGSVHPIQRNLQPVLGNSKPKILTPVNMQPGPGHYLANLAGNYLANQHQAHPQSVQLATGNVPPVTGYVQTAPVMMHRPTGNMQSVPGNLQFNIPVQGKFQSVGNVQQNWRLLPVMTPHVPQASVNTKTDDVTVATHSPPPPMTLPRLPPGVTTSTPMALAAPRGLNPHPPLTPPPPPLTVPWLPPGVSLTRHPSSAPGANPVLPAGIDYAPATVTLVPGLPASSEFVPGNVQLIPGNIPPVPENVPALLPGKTREVVLATPLEDGERIKLLSFGGQNDEDLAGIAQIHGNTPQIPGNVPCVPGNMSQFLGDVLHHPGNVPAAAVAAEESMPQPLQVIPVIRGNVIKP